MGKWDLKGEVTADLASEFSADITTRAGFVLPAAAHERYLAQRRRRRRREVQHALKAGTKVAYSPEQLEADGWGPRQIKRVTR